jgi:hypothetical protein
MNPDTALVIGVWAFGLGHALLLVGGALALHLWRRRV